MTILATFAATAVLLSFLQAQMPAQIQAVNADTPAETPLTDFATYLDHEVTHLPETPVLVVLPNVLTIENDQTGFMETSTSFEVVIVVGDSDEAALASALRRYVAAVARCVASTRTGTTVPSPNGASLYWGAPAGMFSPIWTAAPNAGGSGFYQDAHLSLSVLLSEVL